MSLNLHQAARANDTAALRNLKPGPDLNPRDADGMTPLLVAARFGSADAVAALLACGADVSARDNVGMTALHLAALYNRFALIRPLLEAGISVDGPTPKGSTPLMAAAAGAAIKATEELLALGADPNAQNQEGKTALIYADSGSNPWIIKPMLTKAGANPSAGPDKETRRRAEALLKAAAEGDIARIKQLLDQGVPVDGEPAFSETALFKAAAHGQFEAAELLLQAGANPHARRFNGDTPLMSAVYTDSTELIRLLLEKGANVNAIDKNGETALMNAASSGNGEIARILLEAGADVAAQTLGRGERPRTAADFAKEIVDRKEKKAMLDLLTSRLAPKAAAQTLATEASHDAVETFPTAAKQPAFQQVLAMLAELCAAPPRPWKKCNGVYLCAKLKVKELAKRFPAESAERGKSAKRAKGRKSADSDWPLVERLQAEVRAAGFQLVMAEPSDKAGAAKWLVLPTADQYAALAACKTDAANHGHGTNDIIAWLQELDRDNPFVLTACGGDFVAGQFKGPVKNPAALAERMCRFCPDLVDGDIVESPAQVADQLRESQAFSLWWG